MSAPTPLIADNENIARDFTLFPNLPVELQLRIWELSIRPRCIRIDRRFFARPKEPLAEAESAAPDDGKPPPAFEMSYRGVRQPALLRACRQSRRVAKRACVKIRRSKKSVFHYLNPSLDTVSLAHTRMLRQRGPLLHTLDEHQRRKITTISMGDFNLWSTSLNTILETYVRHPGSYRFYYVGPQLVAYPALEELILSNLTVLRFDGISPGSHTPWVNDCPKSLESGSAELVEFIGSFERQLKWDAAARRARFPEISWSSWWAEPKITYLTPEEFQARFET